MTTFKAGGKIFDTATYGKRLGTQELKELEKKTNLTPASLLERYKQAGGNVSSSAVKYSNKPAAPAVQPAGGGSTQAGDTSYKPGGIQSGTAPATDAEKQAAAQNTYDWLAGPAVIQGNALITSNQIRADADKEITKIDDDTRRYGYDLGLQGTKYTADKEAEWRNAVANIEVKGKLDLQPIINAGLQRVAEIEGQSAKDVADITGGYNLKSMKERTAADKALGKMQLAGGMYGLISSVFG